MENGNIRLHLLSSAKTAVFKLLKGKKCLPTSLDRHKSSVNECRYEPLCKMICETRWHATRLSPALSLKPSCELSQLAFP
ncbi:hypothetical protein HOV93_12780 [Planctomycetes bacterium FF15]|uniref:Uncharacterized protein n=1 Tax=Bremerella alba TaxID=980252 RepID=A0A7V9A6C9_9BACT|nr:hypothetical protein [Bremerella alba]